jgi:hypothetical protein
MALKYGFLLSLSSPFVSHDLLQVCLSVWQIQISDMIGVKYSSWFNCVKHREASCDVIWTMNHRRMWHALMKGEIAVLWMDVLAKGIRMYRHI